MDLLIGTGNPGKLREYRHLLAGAPVNLVGLNNVGLADIEVEETGSTLEENATLKARAYARASGLLALADDTGLMVDALDERPGLHSARYGGPGLDDAGRRARLMAEMEGVDDMQRTARFECVIALVNPGEERVVTVKGVCKGHILRHESDGHKGFGYDAIFKPDGYVVTFAQLGPEEKNRISHRGQAARKVIPILHKLMGMG